MIPRKKRLILFVTLICLSMLFAYSASASEHHCTTVIVTDDFDNVVCYRTSSIDQTIAAEVGKFRESMDEKIRELRLEADSFRNTMRAQLKEIFGDVPAMEDLFGKAAVTEAPREGLEPNPAFVTPPDADPSTPRDYTEAELAVLAFTNEYRILNGLPALVLNYELSLAARAHAKDMAEHAIFQHDSSDGTAAGARIARYLTYPYSTWGENIALGYESGESAVNGWINSEGHRANLLNRDFTQIGISCVPSGQGLLWVQDFTD